ncbi:hypothetical protein [Rhodococcoides kyotonense]|uniref:Uncharacterized protein n=1 Tax=Rhodococcoides kyotonense TaxID=398843 RepID=A0A239KW37_9NOCA|nr:hypothetical protein [Rhodococcus kyotonensis]SNT21729.1 hypothetical protein SAMN05421642_111104 [Rhodococcus kyotonensis]
MRTDTEAFTARRGTLATPIAFGVASVVEIVAVHFLVPWPWLQWTLLGLSIVSLGFFVGAIAVHRANPHTATPETLTLRSAGKVVADIPRATVRAARVHRRYGVVNATIENGRLILPTQDGTTVDVELSDPVDAVVPAMLAKWRIQGMVSSLSLQVDDPAALVRALTPPPAADSAEAPSRRPEPRPQPR